MLDRKQPCYTMKVVSEQLNLHPQTIRGYERMGLIKPDRTEGNVRLFSHHDIERLKKIMTFRNMGVNLPGIDIIMKLLKQIEELRAFRDKVKERMYSEFKDAFSENDS